MSTPAFIAQGDAHLSPTIWRKYPFVRGDAEAAFSNLVNVALDHMLPIVLLGDIFDSIEPGPQMLRFLRRQYDRCREEGIKVYVLDGNHDRRPVPWSIAIHDWPVYIGGGEVVEIGGLRCAGFDYAPRDTIQKKLAECLDEPEVVFLHQAVRQFMPIEGRWNCDLDWVPASTRLVVMGDIHKELELRTSDGRPAVYTGATHLRALPERGPKSCLVVNTDLTWGRLGLDARSVEPFVLKSEGDTQAVRQFLDRGLEEGGLPPLAMCYYSADMLLEAKRLRGEFDGRAFVISEPLAADSQSATLDELLADLEASAAPADTALDVERTLTTLVSPAAEPEVYHMVLDLLHSESSVADVILARRTKFFEGKVSK